MALIRSSIVANIPIPTLVLSNLRSRFKTASSAEEKYHVMRGLHDEDDTDFLADTFLRTAWLFQLIVTGPVAVALGGSAFVRLLEVHGPVYDFVTSLFTALIAAAIVFIIIVQRKTFENGVSIHLTLKFETLKSIFATGLWIWCMIDAGVQPTAIGKWNRLGPRMVAASCSSVLLFILFYPTVFYAAREAQRSAGSASRWSRQEHAEHTPLLSRV